MRKLVSRLKKKTPRPTPLRKPTPPATYEIAKALYNTPSYKIWREIILLRDEYTCQMCGKKGGSLEVHHILRKVDRPDLMLEVSNGITLCQACHQKIVTGSEAKFVYIFERIVKLNDLRRENRNLQNREYRKQEGVRGKLVPYPEAMGEAQKRSTS